MQPAAAPDRDVIDTLTRDAQRIRDTVASLGGAIRAADISYPSPSLARASFAAESLYDRLDAEFGFLTSTQAGERLGSRSQAARNLAAVARKGGRLLGLQRGRYIQYPAFQFDEQGVRPVIAELVAVAREAGRTESGLVQWLVSPTTYLEGQRPVDVIDQPETLMLVARDAFGVQW